MTITKPKNKQVKRSLLKTLIVIVGLIALGFIGYMALFVTAVGQVGWR